MRPDRTRPASKGKILLFACLYVAGHTSVFGVETDPDLLRGPYLQMGTPNSTTVRWRTVSEAESIVLYGTDPNNLHLLSGDLEPTTEHEVVLGGLSPQTKYFYSIGDLGTSLAEGPDYFLMTQPPPGRVTPTRIWAI